MQYGGLPINVHLRFTLTWYLLVKDEYWKHAWNLDFNCATAAHRIPFVPAIMGDSFPVRIMHIKGYLRTWCHRYFICAKSRWDRTGTWGRATVRLNSKRSWSPTHLSLSSWPPTTRRLLQCQTWTKLESPLEACQWHCCLLRLGLEGVRTMKRSHADTLLYALL